jgi:hypothetical protein
MSASVQEISNAIKDIVAAAGQVPGSRLSTALKGRSISLTPAEFGMRSLREFVTTHVPGVVVVGRSGMDVLYGLAGSEPPPGPSSPTSEPDFWRVWVSPNSPFALMVNRSGADIEAVRRGESPALGRVVLEPPGIDVHRSIAGKFLETVPESLTGRLVAALEKSHDGWWQTWHRELQGSAQLGAWNTFRRSAFEDRLREQLSAAAMSDRAIDLVLVTIRDRHLAAAPPKRRASLGVDFSNADVDALRRVVLGAVQRMSGAELRDLRLPLGVVLDVLASSKSSR